LEKKAIFFENKINSKEGFKQLKRYAEHVDQITDEEKTLVYLTKHYDLKNPEKIFTDCINDIEFIQIRWHKIYRFFKKYKSD
ncbi:PD-(D/E)XK nuclease family protein, partial [Micrococcus sp. SIMBA_131]